MGRMPYRVFVQRFAQAAFTPRGSTLSPVPSASCPSSRHLVADRPRRVFPSESRACHRSRTPLRTALEAGGGGEQPGGGAAAFFGVVVGVPE